MKISIAVFGRFHAFNLAQQLQKRGHLHSLISTYPAWQAKKYDIDPKLVHALWEIEVSSRIWNRLPQLIKKNYNVQLAFLESFDKKVVNCLTHPGDIFIGWSGACFWSFQHAKKMGALTVVERGSSHMAHQTRILREEYERWGLKFISTHPGVYERELESYQQADRIMIPSLFVKQTFIDEGISENKLIHVPYGTSLTEFYPLPKDDGIFRVIYCGNITLQKGIPYLLQAFYELKLPDAELWLVGAVDPEIEPFLEKYKSDSIFLKGKQPQDQLKWFYSQCSVFCLPSVQDGFGMVIPQAMACGLPVIHSTNTGGNDIVRDNIDGFCVPIRDVEALKGKILFFYENSDRCEEMGKNALEQAHMSLSWDDYGTKIVQAYQATLLTKL